MNGTCTTVPDDTNIDIAYYKGYYGKTNISLGLVNDPFDLKSNETLFLWTNPEETQWLWVHQNRSIAYEQDIDNRLPFRVSAYQHRDLNKNSTSFYDFQIFECVGLENATGSTR